VYPASDQRVAEEFVDGFGEDLWQVFVVLEARVCQGRQRWIGDVDTAPYRGPSEETSRARPVQVFAK
jgi:hypothetical protein